MRNIQSLGLELRISLLLRLPEIEIVILSRKPCQWKDCIDVLCCRKNRWAAMEAQSECRAPENREFCWPGQVTLQRSENPQWIIHACKASRFGAIHLA